MKKPKVDISKVANELKQGSVFFRNSNVESVSDKELAVKKANRRTGERVNARTGEHLNDGSREQVNRRTGERSIKRNSYNIFIDQINSIKRLAFEKNIDQSTLVRTIIDEYLKANG